MVTEDHHMRTVWAVLNRRISGVTFDGRAARLACCAVGVLVVPMALRALARHPGSRAEYLLGVGLAMLVGLLCVMLGLVCGTVAVVGSRVAARARWPEYVSDAVGIGLFVL